MVCSFPLTDGEEGVSMNSDGGEGVHISTICDVGDGVSFNCDWGEGVPINSDGGEGVSMNSDGGEGVHISTECDIGRVCSLTVRERTVCMWLLFHALKENYVCNLDAQKVWQTVFVLAAWRSECLGPSDVMENELEAIYMSWEH